MGRLKDLLSGSADSEDLDNYVELDADNMDVAKSASQTIQIAEYENQRDLMAIKDALYDGNIVFVEITTLRGEDRSRERLTEELRRVVDDIGGDIVQKGEEYVIVAPSDVAISRKKLTD